MTPTSFLAYADQVEAALEALDGIGEIPDLTLPEDAKALLYAASRLVGEADVAIFERDEEKYRAWGRGHTEDRALHRFLVRAIDLISRAADMAGDGAGPPELFIKIEAAGLALADVCLTWQERDFDSYCEASR